MKTFDDLETEFARVAVRIAGKAPPGAGLLTLGRAKTLVTLSTKKPFYPKTDVNGWFDLGLKQGNQTILLHNALVKQQCSHGRRATNQETDIFPNTVVFNAGALGRASKVASISFRIEKLRDFFVHEVIESQFLYEAPKEILDAIKRLRTTQEVPQYPREYDFFDPDSLYLVHRPPLILSFKVGDTKYELSWGVYTRGLGWDSINVRAEPIARIIFSKATSIDDAIDKMWSWKRLFSQLAMEKLKVTALSASGRRQKNAHTADLYLPYWDKGSKREDNHRDSFQRGDSPCCRWSERNELANVMETWLSKDAARSTFRIYVDRVIANLEKGTSMEDIVTLCSAIESLDELKKSSPISDGEIDTISNGAMKAASEAKIAIEIGRIKGVLRLLRHQSLPQRLKAVLAAISPHVTPDQAKRITTNTLSLRAIAAHGNSLAEFAVPRVRPTVVVLAGVCVLYDQLTSACPIKANEHHRLRALGKIDESLLWLSHLESRATAKG